MIEKNMKEKPDSLFQAEYNQLEKLKNINDTSEQISELIDIAGSIVSYCSPPQLNTYLKNQEFFHHEIQNLFNLWKEIGRKTLQKDSSLKDELEILSEREKFSLLPSLVQRPWYEDDDVLNLISLIREAASENRKVLQKAREKAVRKENGEKIKKISEIRFVKFEEKSSRLVTDKNEICDIPTSTNQFIICKNAFGIPEGDWLKRVDVIDDFFSKGKDSFYDATREVNKRSLNCFKIKILEYSTDKTRVRPDLREKTP